MTLSDTIGERIAYAVRFHTERGAGDITTPDLIRPVVEWWLRSRGIDPAERSTSVDGFVGVNVIVPVERRKADSKLHRLVGCIRDLFVSEVLQPVCIVNLRLRGDLGGATFHFYRHGPCGLAMVFDQEDDRKRTDIAAHFLVIDVEHVALLDAPHYRAMLSSAVHAWHELVKQRIARPARPSSSQPGFFAGVSIPQGLEGDPSNGGDDGLGRLGEHVHAAEVPAACLTVKPKEKV